MKKTAFLLSFMLLGFVGFSNLNSMNLENTSSNSYTKMETKTVGWKCFVRYCVETPNGLSCTEWKEVPCAEE